MEKKYQNRVVGFIDILGFKDFVRRSKQDSTLVKTLYDATTNHSGDVRKYLTDAAESKTDLRTTSFSDCVVLSDIGDVFGLITVIGSISEIVVRLQYSGLLCRGGIDVGDLYHDNEAVFGPALVKAYELESKIAEFPQIVLSSGIMNLIEGSSHDSDFREFFRDFVQYDKNSNLFRMEPFCIFDEPNIERDSLLPFTAELFCGQAKSHIIDGILKNIDNPCISRKYKWAADQLNGLIDRKELNIEKINTDSIYPWFQTGLPS